MRLLPLSQFARDVHAGAALRWGVRDATGKLLLARGHVVADATMAAALLERGTFVDAEEAHAAGSGGTAEEHSAAGFIARWDRLHNKLTSMLHSPAEQLFLDRIRESVNYLEALSDANADLLIFLILRQDQNRHSAYGVMHALHVASACSLLAHRLKWDEADRACIIGAALTMNLSIVELQGRLAVQNAPLTPAQRQKIQEHPTSSAALLRKAGLEEPRWLAAVEQHHEAPGGKGYPAGIEEPGEMAQLLRYVDIFTAKLSPRATRSSMAANVAARELFVQNNGHPHVALLIKEFGIYPPGCFVRLASGETAIVLHRGSSANAPIVACLNNKRGDPMPSSVRRDTSQAEYAVVSVVPDENVLVRVPWDKLYDERLSN